MIYQHIKSDVNDTKCMLQNRQNNTVSPPAALTSQASEDDDDEHSRRQEFCTGKSVSREPCTHPETQLAGQTCFRMCLHPLLRLSAGVDVAVCCILSALAFFWWKDQFRGVIWRRGRKGRRFAGFALLSDVTLWGNMKSVVHPHLVQHGIQEGTHTQFGMWCSRLECMIRGMLRFGEETEP